MDAENQRLIKILRSECLSRGFAAGIKGLGHVFRTMDTDFSKRQCFEEFKNGIKLYGIKMDDSELFKLFNAFDNDQSGSIDFVEFIKHLRPPMSAPRVAVVREAFRKLDVNGDKVIALDDLKVVFENKSFEHPKYRSGEWTKEQTLQNFLNGLDTPGAADGKVTEEEFLTYYEGVSITVEDDAYFDMMMRLSYSLPPKSMSQAN